MLCEAEGVSCLDEPSNQVTKTAADDIEQDVSVSIQAPLERAGEGFKGAITFLFFCSTGPSCPQPLFACDLGKGIIRGRDGNQRPGEMNSGAPPAATVDLQKVESG